MSAILVVGDALLDRDVVGRVERLSPEQPVPVLDQENVRARPGGAALAAALVAGDGHDVVLLTAIGHDEAGVELGDLLADAGVVVVNVGLDGTTPEKVRLRSGDHLLCRLDRNGGTPRAASSSVARLVEDSEAVLVSDYGRGLCADPRVREALASASRLVWDPHPRGAPPIRHATLVTPNESEARAEVGPVSATVAAELLVDRWSALAVCVTCGERGAVVAESGAQTLTVPVDRVKGDPCGAGDRFAATAAALVALDAPVAEAVPVAVVEARRFVEQGGWCPPSTGANTDGPLGRVERVRREGGVVVATGGCFDLVHAGHVAMLEAARRLGDCLVVCLNSDASVKRLKGPQRPIVGEDDRAALLRALACVDAVVLFDEETPERALERVRPDLFVKGADYDVELLPEAAVMERLGGRVVTVPYVAGRSTTTLIERVSIGVHGR